MSLGIECETCGDEYDSRRSGCPLCSPPLRAASLGQFPEDAKERKAIPIQTGVLDYFPRAIIALADLSKVGNDQHNPGQPLHWDRSKSGDEGDALQRHQMFKHEFDTDGVAHATKVAWRALAQLEKFLETQENPFLGKKAPE